MERTKTAPPLTTDPASADLAKPTMERSAGVSAKPPSGGSLAQARAAVRDFLLHEFHPREIRITKITPSPDGAAAEAEILVPDLSVKMLGLPLSREVLQKQFCRVELDSKMTVKSYEFVDPQDR